jgi:hypothetical protein
MTAAPEMIRGGCMALSDVPAWQSHKQSTALRQKFFLPTFSFKKK